MPNPNFSGLAYNSFSRMQGALIDPQRPDGGRHYSSEQEWMRDMITEMSARQRRIHEAMRHCATGLTQLAGAIQNLEGRRR